ncbi:MAG TPA: hypothetical protein VNM50_01485, partial [Chloroflexota bacterium]|nr:hypothetical protein [Chloroflexota bacterium]
MAQADEIIVPRLTPEEREQGLAAMARARKLREALLHERGGRPFPPSWKALAELREARRRERS